MRLPLYEPPEAEVLWRVMAHGRQRVAPGRGYWYDNHQRAPLGTVVVQASLAGQIVLRDAAGEHPVGPGQVVVFAYGEPTSYGLPAPSRQPYVCRWLNLQGAGLDAHIDALRRQHGPVLDVGTSGAVPAAMDELAELAGPDSRAAQRDTAAAVHRLIMALFEAGERRQQQAMSPVERAVEQIVRRPAQPWSLQQLADQHGCSREHLSRVFHARTGQTPAQYIAAARLRRALQLIEQTELPIHAVAAQAGFATTHTLTRQVRDATGRSPSALRAEAHRR